MTRRSRATSDVAWWRPAAKPISPCYRELVRTAQYITVSDGTRIAVDLYLPKDLPDHDKVPAILIQTPYFRGVVGRFPFLTRLLSKLMLTGPAREARHLASFGYGVVAMDARGSGASFGCKRAIMMSDCVRDGREIVDWVAKQRWCNGNVGATGVSAVGMIANWLTTTRHPALKAIVPRFTTFDIFAATHPGGLMASRFVGDIGHMLRMMDQNRLHAMSESRLVRFVVRLLIKGVRPVDDDRDGSMLAAASASHAANEYFDSSILAVEYRDDRLPNAPEATLDTQSPFRHAAEMQASGVAIYSVAGWLDGAFIRDLISLHNTVRTPGSKLLIGPWGHGGRFYCSPVVRGLRPSEFDHIGEMTRFFDLHLKGKKSSLIDEPAIHYFSMGTESWQASEVWPPAGLQTHRLYLDKDGRLNHTQAAVSKGSDRYRVDFSASTGVHSRFGEHLTTGRTPVVYPNRCDQDRRLLCYDSPVLDCAMEVTGHPVITLFIDSSAPDAAIFVYLEDVLPSGSVLNVTEGFLRARHWKISDEDAPYWQAGPYRTMTRAEASPLTPGEIIKMVFDLLPTSYVFKKGHRIRLAVAGADRDCFRQVPASNEAPVLHFHRGGSFPAGIDLPVVPFSHLLSHPNRDAPSAAEHP